MNIDEKTRKNLDAFKPQIETISTRGIALVVFLLAVIGWGVYALYVQISEGHIVTGMRDNVVWGLYIVNFIFFIGISYAGALISGILHLLRVPWRTPIIRMAEMITVISTLIGPAYILLCIGRLDRLPNLILFGRIQSPIVWDVIAISTYLSGSIIFLYLAMIRDMAVLRDNPVSRWKWRNALYRFFSVRFQDTQKQKELLNICTDLLSIVIIPLAILVHSVLAWIFGMTLRPGWHSTIFAPYFVVAAVYSGTGVLILVMWAFRKVYKLEHHITKIHFNYLAIIMIVLGALYGYFTFSEYLTSWYGSIKWDMEVLYRLFSPEEFFSWFIFSVFIGVLLPIIIVTVPRFRNINSIAFAAAIAVLALWVKRYLIIIPTLESPLLPVHDLRPEYVHYAVTWVEWALTFAGVALFILLFFLFSKFIPILPVMHHGEEKDYSRLRKKVYENQMKKLIDIRKKSDSVTAVLLLLFILTGVGSVFSQDSEPAATRLKLDYFYKSGSRVLQAKVMKKTDNKYKPFEGAEVTFVYSPDKEKRELGKSVTDEKGIAFTELPDDLFAGGGEKGIFSFAASYAGDKMTASSEGSASVKNASMEMSFSLKDSVKSVNCKVMETGSDGKLTPVNDIKVAFYVPRTFTLLKIGESSLVNGEASADFPVTLPGDTAGFLTVVAKIEDNETYGNLEAGNKINWAKHLVVENPIHRGLGDTNAPLWMVYTLIVLLSLVWFHYLYVVITVFRIRHIGKKFDVK
jgi:molybdopterin-containing oxidoreductase family membrane subunit